MWESLPPVASASVVSADQLTGVSVATHSSGMIGSTAPAPCADRTPALTTRSPMPPVASSAASTPSAANSVGTPRDASLNSSPGNAAPPSSESSAHTNLAGGASSPFVGAPPPAAAASAPPAMVNPFAATSAASSPLRTAASLPSRSFASASASTAGTPLPSGAVMTAVEHVARSGGSGSGAVVHSSIYRIPPPPQQQQQQQQDASSSRDGFPTTYTMSGATTVAAAPAPPSQHPRSLSASALQYPAPRHPPPLTPSSTTAVNAHASAAAAAPAAALGASFMATPTSAARHTAALLPPRTPPESSPMHRSLTSATLAPTTTAASRLDGRTAAAATAITRSVSPRHPHASASTPAHAASASFASQSATNAVWQSPGSISLGSGRLNADAASLYYSPNASEHREGSSSRSTGGGGGGSFFPASGSGDAAARALASAARAAAPLATPDRRYTAVPFNNVNANRESGMMGNSSGSNTAITAAPVSLSDLRPAAALPTPPPPPMRPPLPAVTPIFSSTEVGGVGGTTISMVAPPHPQQNSSAHHTNNHSSSGSGGVAESSGVSGTSLTFVSPHFQNAGGAVEVSLTTPTLPVTSQPPPPTGGSSQPPSTSPTMLISAATPASTTTAAPNTTTATAAGAAFNTTVSGSRTGLQGGTPSSFLSRAPAAAVAAQRGGGELVQVVGTEGTASAVASLPPTQPSAAAADPPPCYESLDDARQHHAYSSPPSTRLAEAFTTPGAINSSSVNGGGGGAGGGVLPCEAGASPSSGVGTPPYAATTPLPAPYSQSPAPPPRPPQPVFTSYYSSPAVGGGSGGPNPRTSLPSLTPSSQHLCPGPAPAAAAPGGLWADPAHTQLTLAQLGVGGVEAAAAHGGGAGGSIASGALPSASMDHNQSFYMGTTGNDNLRRSFFFPPSARGGHGGQHEEASVEDGGGAATGAATTAAGGSVDGHRLSYDLASYLRHPAAAAPRSCSTDHAGLSRASSPTNANAAAFPAAAAAYPFSITPPSVNGEVGGVTAAAAAGAAAVGGMPASTASAASTETTDGGTSYGSPVLYRVASFPPNASLQPSPSMAGRPGQLSGRSARDGGGGGEATMSPGTLARGLTSPLPPLQQQQQQQQMSMPVAGGVGGPPVAVPGQPRSSTAEDPLRITVDQRGRPAVTNPSASASSPYMTPHSAVVMPPMAQQQLQHFPGGGGSSVHSARVPQLEESLRATTAHGTNASFLSPTMATSVLRHRFEESILTAHSEASFALPDSSSAVAVNRVNSQGSPVAAAASVAGGSGGGVPVAYQGETTAFSPYTLPPALVSSSALSLPATPQHPAAAAAAAPAFSPPPSAAAAPAAVTSAPAPAYVVDWERSLVAFQNRAESYYTFKNLCTETYLTLVEHDVDRFLVCYYSGGAVKPEEAVQGAVSSRAGTPAATAARVMSSTHDSSTASSSNTAAGSASAGGGGRGGGLQKMIQTNKTLQKLSETGAKWLTNLKRTAMTPMPVSVEPKTPMSSTGTSTPAQEVRSGSSSVGSGSIDPQASTRRPLPQPPVPAAPTNGAADATVRGAAAGTTAVASPSVGSAELGRAAPVAAGDDGLAALYYGGRDPASAASMESGEPTFSYGGPLTGPAGLTGADTGASNGSSIANISSSASRPGSSGGGELSQQLVLDRPLSSSGKSLGGCGAAVDNLSVTSSSSAAAVAAAAAALGVGTPRKQQQPSRLSYNIAADAEMQCLRQLGTYMANVIPDSYMDIRPSEQVLQHVRRNYAILLNALQHVLLMSGVDHPLSEAARGTGGNGGGSGGGQASQAARALICSRIRQGLLIPSIQATWRDYLAPLEMKAKELVAIATTNIDPILEQLQNTPPDGAGLPAADVEARQRLRALREQPVRRLVRLLRGDEEYLTTIHTMDDEFVEQGEAWRQRSAAMRQSGAALSDYVPVYGLVLSRLHRLEIEHRTVLELWCGGVQAALP